MHKTTFSPTPSMPEATIVPAAGLFGYTQKARETTRSEMIDVKRFVALYGEAALESLLSSRR